MQEANGETPLGRVRSKMAQAAKIAQRDVQDFSLIAISKTRSAAEIELLLDAGHRVFGENRVQEAAEKWPALQGCYKDIELHLVGQLQSNKAADAVMLFDFIHALDRPSLVKALGKAMRETGRKPGCFIQVNIGEEAQKGGCAISEIAELLEEAGKEAIPVKGLMCIPPANKEAAPYFALLAQLARKHRLPCLSMGMSGDFESAIMLGATHIRVGTALFGERE